MATDVARLSLDISVNGAKRAQSAMESLQSGAVRLTRATQEQIAAQNRLNSTFTRQSTPAIGRFGQRLTALRQSFKLQRGAVQQAGFQFQDFAVQVGAGQSALVAFSQQGSQLAGILGPGGAVLGAVIAIGAALAGPFVRGMMESERETKSLIERIEGLEVSYEDLNGAIRENLRLEKARAEARIENQIAEISTELRIAEQRVKSYNNALKATGQAGARFSGAVDADELKDAQDNVIELGGDLGFLGLELEETRARYEKYISGTDEAGESAAETAKKIREMVEAAEQQAATIGMSERAIATYKAALAGANAEQILAIDSAYRRIEAEEAKQEALKESERREIATRKALMASTQIGVEDDPLLQRIEAEKRGQQILLQQQRDYATARQNLDQQILSSAASTAGNLANVVGQLAGEQSNAYRAAFLAQQGFAIASAIVNTQLAAAAALAPPPIGLGPVAGLPYAGTIEALGAANVAIIAGQTVAGLASSYSGGGDTESFLGGGYTGTGSRTGGVDGKGGFPAILHPNETVIDHERAGAPSNSSSVNQTIVMNVSGDVTAKTRQEILKAIPMIRQQARQSVLQASQEGGAMSRAMGRR